MSVGDLDPALVEGLARYWAERDKQRLAAVDQALAMLRPYERRLVKEAAVMGFVRGVMTGRSRATLGKPRDGDVPENAMDILVEVIDACIAVGDIYPYIAEAARGRRRRITKSRRWPGEEGSG